MNYIEELEKQNDELRQRLAVSESKVAEYESIKGYIRFQKELKADPEGAWGWFCNIVMPIHDNSSLSHKDSYRVGTALMKHLWDIDITTHENYEEPL